MPSAAESSDLPVAAADVWLMHCAEGPVPRASAEAVRRFLPRETRPWELDFEGDFIGLPQRTRDAAAEVLGGRAEDVALTPTTSSGLATFAQAFPWNEDPKRGPDEVLVPLGEFPANLWPWRALAARGVSLRQVPIWDGHRAGDDAWQSDPPRAPRVPEESPEERLLAAVGPRTRVVSASWVRFQDGLVLDLETLARGCRERGVALVVDGIQGAGTLAIDLDRLGNAGLWAFATGGHKGLLAPQGLGVLWTRAAAREALRPTGSWLSVEGGTDFRRPSTDLDRDWLATGERFEQGVPNLLGCAAFEASLRTLLDARGPDAEDDPDDVPKGAHAIERHVARLRARLLDGLARMEAWTLDALRLLRLDGAGRLGSIVALHHGSGEEARGFEGLESLRREAARRGLHVSVREGYLRIALHGWHTDDDVDRVLDWLSSA